VYPRLKYSLELTNSGDVRAGPNRVAQRRRIILYSRITATVRYERRGCEASSGAIERRYSDPTIDVAVAATLTNYPALTEYEYDASEIGVTSHRQGASHDKNSRAARQRAITIDKREHAVVDRVGDGRGRTTPGFEIPAGRLRFALQTVEISA